MIPKPERMYPMNTKCTKWSYNIPNVCKIFQMAIKYIDIFKLRPYKIYPNWEFWFENKPSGNSGLGCRQKSAVPHKLPTKLLPCLQRPILNFTPRGKL
jgi:hypothetical protein